MEGEPEAYVDKGIAPLFTTKEMLIRMDGKLDTVLGRQAHYDVELALLQARVAEQEKLSNKVLTDLERADAKMRTEVSELRAGQLSIGRALKWAAAVIIGVGVILDAVARFYQ